MYPSEKPLDNPINWSFKAGRLFGIQIRIHVVFVLCAVMLIAMQIPKDNGLPRPPLGTVLVDALALYVLLFGVVLLHEFGHCFGARYMGGEADEILLWPLGGLAYTSPPHNPAAHMITTIAGPTVNVLICMVCTIVLVLWTGSLGGVPWNPLHPMWPVDAAILPTPGQLWVMRLFGVSYLLLLFNLLPIFPFDGGRIVQAWLWPKKGYHRSMEIATGTGMVGAILVGLFGLFLGDNSWLLIMIAVFGYLTCYRTRLMLRETGEISGGEFGYDFSRGYASLDPPEAQTASKPGFFERRRIRKDAARAQRERRLREERERAVERILAKISRSGIESLTPAERAVLKEETERHRSMQEDASDVT